MFNYRSVPALTPKIFSSKLFHRNRLPRYSGVEDHGVGRRTDAIGLILGECYGVG